MEKKAGNNSNQFENELKKKFIRFQPDENFVKKLSDKLFEQSSITLENSKKYLYNFFFILFGLFSGYFLIRIIKSILKPKKQEVKNNHSKISQPGT